MKQFTLSIAFVAISFLFSPAPIKALQHEEHDASLSQADMDEAVDMSQGSLYHDESYDGYFNDDLGTGMGSRWYNSPSGR